MSTLRQASAQLHPLQDSADNNNIYDATGNKLDTATTTVATNKSAMSYIKGIVSYITGTMNPLLVLIKAKTDLIPSDITSDTSVGAIVVASETIITDKVDDLKAVVGSKTDAEDTYLSASDDTKTLFNYTKSINNELRKINYEPLFESYGQPNANSLGGKINAIKTELDLVKIEVDKIGNEDDNYIVDQTIFGRLACLQHENIYQYAGPTPPVESIAGCVLKIDKYATNGLLGIEDSLAYRVAEIERHIHSNERWFAQSATPSGTVNVADRVGTSASTPFTLDAGNNTWGSWVAICGSGDTPDDGASVYFDIHSFQTTANERNATYFLQIGYGTTGADVLTNGTYTEKALTFDGINNERDFTIQGRRIPAGSIVWARTYCPGHNTATVSFYYGIHEYEG